MRVRTRATAMATGCIHAFRGQCMHCGASLSTLTAEVQRLDGALRAVLGHLVLGNRVDAEKRVREAISQTPMFTDCYPSKP